MKILFVTDLYPVGEENIARALFYMVKEWQRQGHKIDVIRPNFMLNTLIRGRKIIKEKVYVENDIKIYNLNFVTPFWFNVYNKLTKDFSLNDYDVLISHMPSGALTAEKLLKRNKIKYVCAVHSSDIIVLTKLQYAFYFRQKLMRAYKQADKISARSPVLQDKIENLMPEVQDKTFVAYSGLNDEILKNRMIKKPFSEKSVTVSTAANLVKRKNIDIIIKSLPYIGINNIKLVIMGGGKERKRLEKLVNRLNLGDVVKFTGQLSRNEVFDNLAVSDIFVLLSDNETFGLCYLEAMMTDNIVIAKKGDGIDGILQNNKNAFLINPDERELAACLKRVLSMKDTEIEDIRHNAFETIKQLNLSSAASSYLENIER